MEATAVRRRHHARARPATPSAAAATRSPAAVLERCIHAHASTKFGLELVVKGVVCLRSVAKTHSLPCWLVQRHRLDLRWYELERSNVSIRVNGIPAPAPLTLELDGVARVRVRTHAVCSPGTYSAAVASSCSSCPGYSSSSSNSSNCVCNTGYSASGSGSTLVCTGKLLDLQ